MDSRSTIQSLPACLCCVLPSLAVSHDSATAMIVMGGAMERGAIGPSCVFIFIWSTIVYDPIACWTWNPAGFLYKLGSLDFAGGGNIF
jgi:ammonium transporter, Amt family